MNPVKNNMEKQHCIQYFSYFNLYKYKTNKASKWTITIDDNQWSTPLSHVWGGRAFNLKRAWGHGISQGRLSTRVRLMICFSSKDGHFVISILKTFQPTLSLLYLMV